MQITEEWQGVKIIGSIIWAVDEEGDGPFKFYKLINNSSTGK